MDPHRRPARGRRDAGRIGGSEAEGRAGRAPRQGRAPRRLAPRPGAPPRLARRVRARRVPEVSIAAAARARPTPPTRRWTKARKTLADPAFEKKNFKRAFNAYSDNVYYERSDPDRANLYLLGGTPPSNKQTIQYLHRNDALDNVEKLQSEIDYLLTNKDGDSDPSDAKAFYAAATKAFDAYFALCPEEDKRDARALLRTS